MRLKELITRSGGVITAIALLGSMMSMAGAAIGTFPCSICSKSYTEISTDLNLTKSYQDAYNVADIPNLVNSNTMRYTILMYILLFITVREFANHVSKISSPNTKQPIVIRFHLPAPAALP